MEDLQIIELYNQRNETAISETAKKYGAFCQSLLGVYGSNIFLIISTIILGIGHIGIHLGHYKKIRAEMYM